MVTAPDTAAWTHDRGVRRANRHHRSSYPSLLDRRLNCPLTRPLASHTSTKGTRAITESYVVRYVSLGTLSSIPGADSMRALAQRTTSWSRRREMAISVGARPILAPGWSGGVHTDIALVDCDVHQSV